MDAHLKWTHSLVLAALALVAVAGVARGAIGGGLAGACVAPAEDHLALRAHHELPEDLGTAEELER